MSSTLLAPLEMAPSRAVEQLETELGLSNADIARALNTNPRTVLRWLAGQTFPQHAARRRLAALDLPQAAMTLKKNGEIKSTGRGSACMGDPILAVAWLANAMGGLGETLRPGDIILSGAFGPVVPFSEGDRCEVEISDLGSVCCSYGAN